MGIKGDFDMTECICKHLKDGWMNRDCIIHGEEAEVSFQCLKLMFGGING